MNECLCGIDRSVCAYHYVAEVSNSRFEWVESVVKYELGCNLGCEWNFEVMLRSNGDKGCDLYLNHVENGGNVRKAGAIVNTNSWEDLTIEKIVNSVRWCINAMPGSILNWPV